MNSRSFIVVGLAYGDESKGATVDKLCRQLPVDQIIRFNGGCQCAHTVSYEDGSHHIFSQFGSGSLVNDKIKTYLSRFMLVEPFSMMKEGEALIKLGATNIWDRVTVDKKAVVVTTIHRYVNRLRERARGKDKHSSCGRGIGVARELQIKYGNQVLLAGDLKNSKLTHEKLDFIYTVLCREMSELEDKLNLPTEDFSITIPHTVKGYASWPAKIVDSLEPSECMVFEGAQGVLLDERPEFMPYNTWTNTTFDNAITLLDEVGASNQTKIGCLRTYYTRHGAGPFRTEQPDLAAALPELHNIANEYQGSWRVGSFDFYLAKNACSYVGGIDYLALSHIDYLPALGIHDTKEFLDSIRFLLDKPICMKAKGPKASDRVLNYIY